MIPSSAMRKQYRVLVPGEFFESHFLGKPYGIYHEESGVLNVLGAEPDPLHPEAGQFARFSDADEGEKPEDDMASLKRSLAAMLFGNSEVLPEETAQKTDDYATTDDSPLFTLTWHTDGSGNLQLDAVGPEGPCEVKRYDLHQDVFSRNTGILETSFMDAKRAVIFGCGSVGSLIALELARSGVGNFMLVDADIMEYHNICRHQCGVGEVGRYKVNALRDRIHNINPQANVEVFYGWAEDAPKELFDEWFVEGESIAIGCADNRMADAYVNGRCVLYKVPFLSVGFWERAFAGELFYWLPGQDMPCYHCAVGTGGGISQRANTNHHVYTNQEDLAAVNFEPGISVDINFVTTVGVKLALDILNRGNDRFTPRLLPTLQQYTLVCNTNNPVIGGEMAEIFAYPLQVTTSLHVAYGRSCPPCEYE